MINLSSKTLAQVGSGVAVSGYDRTVLRPGIVHIGVGNFHRVHQAVAVEDCLHLPDHENWGICGVGLGDGEAARAKAAAFAGQDGLYTVTACWPDGRVSARVVGAMIEYLHAPADPEAVLRRLAAPDTRIVSLTITEGAYNIDEASALFLLDTPDVVHDLPASRRGPPSASSSRRCSADGRPGCRRSPCCSATTSSTTATPRGLPSPRSPAPVTPAWRIGSRPT
jgi:mannitol 2-dehydrogenase